MVEQAVILADSLPATGSGGPGAPDQVLLGLGLLQRMVMALAAGGIRRVLVLTAESGERLESLAQCWRRSGAEVKMAGAAQAELPLADAPFLLLDGMIVLGSGLVADLGRRRVETEQRLVGGDEGCPSTGFSGLALCRAGFFPRLLAGRHADPRRKSVADLLAQAPVLPVSGNGWVKVDSAGDMKRARRLLRLSLGKPSDGFFSRHLNRRFSWPISRLLMRLGATPNQVTWGNLALGLCSGWLIGRGGYGNTLAAGLLFQFVSILDGSDGEIARLTYRFSNLGARLDNLSDTVVLVLFFLNLPIGLHAATGDPAWLARGGLMLALVAVFYLLLLLRVRWSGHRGNIAEIAHQVQNPDRNGGPLNWLERLGTRLGFIFRKEFISIYAMAWCLVGHAEGLLWTLIGLVPLGIVYQLDSLRKLKKTRTSAA